VAVWFRDISARVRLQRALRKQERLASLGGMSGAVAHHYNNLIQGISCNIDYAKRQRTLASMLRALEQAGEPLSRAAEITQQLLIFAQADHRWNDTADLTETFLQFGDEQEKRLAQKNIRLNLDWQKIPITPIYRDHLLIILANLTKNAIEAMPEGGTLSMTLARRDEHSVLLTVTDTGRGIGPETMERIFEPFCTSKSELTGGQGRNTGLGLAVAHGLVAEMHGTIHADNVPGRGARFDIVLPLETQD
jgi:signal transduction histidine kinase